VAPTAKVPAAAIDKSKPTTISPHRSVAALIPAFRSANQIPSEFQSWTPHAGVAAIDADRRAVPCLSNTFTKIYFLMTVTSAVY
jgi:hypothetical protein